MPQKNLWRPVRDELKYAFQQHCFRVVPHLGNCRFLISKLLRTDYPFGSPKRQSQMLVTIQKDESIRSFVERTVFVSQGEPIAKALHKISTSYFDMMDLRKIASVLKWPGVYGFNRLLHCHSDFPIRALLKHYNELAYSGSAYSMKHFRYEDSPASYCPDCVREDLDNIGFTYWRRLHRQPWSVCARHNIKLINRCPFCDEPFKFGRHALNFLWSGCNGHYVSESSSSPNMDVSALRAARDAHDICEFRYHLPAQMALDIINSRINTLVEDKAVLDVNQSFFNMVNQFCVHYGYYKVPLTSQSRECTDTFLKALSYGFESFDDFVVSIGCDASEMIKINDLWLTHQFYTSLDQAAYVEENYRSGIGIFFFAAPKKKGIYKGYRHDIQLDNEILCGSFKGNCTSDGPARASMFSIPRLGKKTVDDFSRSSELMETLKCFSSRVIVSPRKGNAITEDEFQELENLLEIQYGKSI